MGQFELLSLVLSTVVFQPHSCQVTFKLVKGNDQSRFQRSIKALSFLHVAAENLAGSSRMAVQSMVSADLAQQSATFYNLQKHLQHGLKLTTPALLVL